MERDDPTDDRQETTKMEYEAIRSTDQTDDDFVDNCLYPLKTWEWFDGAME